MTRRTRRSADGREGENGVGRRDGGIGRREFLKSTALASAAAGLWPTGPALGAEPARVARYVRLGRTGLEISDIGFGAGRLSEDPGLVRHALDRGVNYFDTAEGYGDGESEKTVGEALAGKRNDVILVSKVKASAKAKRAEIMKRLDASLVRLRTDHVDIYLNHAVNDVERMQNEEWGEFVVRAKEAGKIRFSGMSGHAGRLIECLDWSLDHDLLDVMLVAYNFGQDPSLIGRLSSSFDFIALQQELPRVLAKAKEKDVGVVAMKTLLGARNNDMRPYEVGGATFAQAAFRWVLSDPKVHALIVSMKSREMIDEYLRASGAEKLTRGDPKLLDRYLALNGGTQCRYGCGDCASSCPHDVPVSDVLRMRMYDVDYGERAQARREYTALDVSAAVCAACSGAPCADACSYGLDLHSLTTDSHRRLA